MRAVGTRGARRGALACLVMLMALAAAGCSRSSATPQIIYITPPPGPATPGPSPAIDGVLISTAAPDGRWTVTFKKPLVSGLAETELTKINNAIAAQIDGYINSFTGSSLPALSGGSGPSTLEGDYTIALDTSSLLSLRFTMLQYVSGAAHPVATPGSINFDLSTGGTIALTDILADPNAALPVLTGDVHQALASSLGSDLTWNGSASSLTFFDKAWAMTSSGLEFTWAQGDLATMAAGMPSATLPWSSIKPIVKASGPAGQFVK
jgi:hypothetical protein